MRRLLKVLLALATVLVIAAVGLIAFGSFRAKATRNAWAETLGSDEDFKKRYPERPANEAEQKPLAAFTTAQLMLFLDHSRRDDAVAAPPPEVAAFRTQHADAIEAIVSHVLSSDAMLWDRAVRWEAPLPSLAGRRELDAVLLSEALERNRLGDRAGALRALDACWRINADLRAAPRLVQHVITMASDTMQFGALRRMGPLPQEWQRRVREHDYRQALLIALQGEHVSFVEYAGRTEADRKEKESLWDRLFRRVSFELSLSSNSDAMRQLILRLRDADPCALDPAAFQKEMEGSMPWRNAVQIAIPSYMRTWIGSTSVSLDAELTADVLRAREVRAESGAWPQEATPSAVCKGAAWSHEVAPDGTLAIALDRTFPASESFPKPFRLKPQMGSRS